MWSADADDTQPFPPALDNLLSLLAQQLGQAGPAGDVLAFGQLFGGIFRLSCSHFCFFVPGSRRDSEHERTDALLYPTGTEQAAGQGQRGGVPAAFGGPMAREQCGGRDMGNGTAKIVQWDLGGLVVESVPFNLLASFAVCGGGKHSQSTGAPQLDQHSAIDVFERNLCSFEGGGGPKNVVGSRCAGPAEPPSRGWKENCGEYCLVRVKVHVGQGTRRFPVQDAYVARFTDGKVFVHVGGFESELGPVRLKAFTLRSLGQWEGCQAALPVQLDGRTGVGGENYFAIWGSRHRMSLVGESWAAGDMRVSPAVGMFSRAVIDAGQECPDVAAGPVWRVRRAVRDEPSA